LKVIGVVDTAAALLGRAGIEEDEGVVLMKGSGGVNEFVNTAKRGRIWDREPKLRTPV